MVKAILVLLFIVGFVNSSFAQNKTLFTYDVKGNMTNVRFAAGSQCTTAVQTPNAKIAATVAPETKSTETWLKISPVPAATQITIEYALAESGYVSLEIYNTHNEKISVIQSALKNAGVNRVTYNIEKYPQGTYFCVLRTKKNVISKMFMKL